MAAEQNSKVDMSLFSKDFPQFKGAQFRVHGDGTDAEGSVLDTAEIVLGSSNAARSAWFDMQASKDPAVKDIVARSNKVRINGKGKLTPVAPFKVLLEIIFLLPGKRAHDFRKTCATYIARLMAGDLSLIPEIEARFDSSTPEERDFFRNGADETPERKRKREDLEHERRLRLRREAAEVQRLEMENVHMYRGLLEEFGLERDPRMRMLLNDAVANILVPASGPRAVEGPALTDYVTVGKFLLDNGIKDKTSSTVGRHVAKKWREEEGGEPEETMMMVQGDMRPVKVYPVRFLEKHVL